MMKEIGPCSNDKVELIKLQIKILIDSLTNPTFRIGAIWSK